MKLWLEKGGWASKKGREKVERMEPADVRKIAVIRHAALGDMVLTRPFLVELRKHFPKAEITLSLISNYTYGAPDDLVDRVHVFPGRDRRDTPLPERFRSARELGCQDIIFDQAATARSFWLCALNSAEVKVGFPYDWYRNPMFYDISVLRSDFRFEAETLLDMLNILGFRTEWPPDYGLPVTGSAEGSPYIVYFTGASLREKCWPDESFAALIERMARRYPAMDHTVLKGVGDDESIDGVMAPLAALTNVHPVEPMPLRETIDFVGKASLVVSNDTGIRNLAIAAGTPTVGIFFATIPFRYWPRDGLHEVVFHPDGRIPSVDEVFRCVSAHLDRVSEK